MKSTLPVLPEGPSALDPSVVCPPCGKCCRYVAVGIDEPSSVKRVSTALWMVYHKGVSIFESHDGDWFMVVAADCENLQPNGFCGVYQNRPLICREYDVDGCEGTSSEPAEKLKFEDAASFVRWLATQRTALYLKCVERGVIPETLRPTLTRRKPRSVAS